MQRIPGRGSSETIVVVEDEDTVSIFLNLCLKLQGFKVLQARDARECLAICDSLDAAPDLFIVDVLLPDINGPELAVSIRKRYPEAMLLFVSGLPPGSWPDSVRVEFDDLPASDRKLLPKPFQASTLVCAVDNAMHGASAQSN